MSSGPTAQSQRYLYERLGAARFQDLCGALVTAAHPDATCYPVNQSDGGRDITRTGDGGDLVIYQVKWTARPKQDPVGFLREAVRLEAAKIRQLASRGATRYYLLTSVEGTAAPDSGSMDRINQFLSEQSKKLKIKMRCWWRSDINARVDAASNSLKWTYQEMLAGVDAVRYLMQASADEEVEHELRSVLLRVIASQWLEDINVKFKQVELQSHRISDLFIDVEARRLHDPVRAQDVDGSALYRRIISAEPDELGGAADYLLRSQRPLTIVRGEPGQGKSTLMQYLCQVQRAEFLSKDAFQAGGRPKAHTTSPRLPLRVELRDYAAWMTGSDPFSGDQNDRRQNRATVSLEGFLADLLHERSGGLSVTVEMVKDILYRFPVLIVLDGLDEIGQAKLRARAVDEINQFSARLGTGLCAPQLLVTTRPNSSSMPEPTDELFEVVQLNPLSHDLRIEYLRKWASSQGIMGRERRDLERIFRQRSAEPHILQLADNPMQLTILLYLINARGNSIPTARTSLYASYMQTFLDREAAKTPAVEEFREDLEEVTAYLGWHLQSKSESAAGNGQLPTRLLKRAIVEYLFDVDKDTAMVDALFSVVTDRVWALVSKVEGTFEFGVQSLREYFAAKFLHEYASADSADIIAELARRQYWLNTCRFYAGFAKVNELAGLLEGIREEIDRGRRPRQVRLAAWTIMADGVFSARPRSQKVAASFFTDDLSVRLIANALESGSEFSTLVLDRGGSDLVSALRQDITTNCSSSLADERLQVIIKLQGSREQNAWWQDRMAELRQTPHQLPWLKLSARMDAAASLDSNIVSALVFQNKAEAAIAVDAGIIPKADSALARQMVESVLDGACSDSYATGTGFAGDLLKVFAPQHFLRRATGTESAYATNVNHPDCPISSGARRSALTRLVARNEIFAELRVALRTSKTGPIIVSAWSESARILARAMRPCWLAAEITVIGAALLNDQDRFRLGGSTTPGATPFGRNLDYGRLLIEVRLNRSDSGWWNEQYESHRDPLSRATWALALVCVAEEDAVVELIPQLTDAVERLPAIYQSSVVSASSRIGSSGLGRRLGRSALSATVGLPCTSGLLVAHHVADLDELGDLASLDNEALAAMGRWGHSAWPAMRALTHRAVESGLTDELLSSAARFPNDNALPGFDLTLAPPELARQVVDEPASYPLQWVLAAERRVAPGWDEPLERVAEDGQWFQSAL
jgi:hypothetical protein